MGRFDYVKYDDQAMEVQAAFKAAFQAVEALVDKLDEGRAKALVYTNLEQSYMWVGKSIRDKQIHRNGFASLQEDRTDG